MKLVQQPVHPDLVGDDMDVAAGTTQLGGRDLLEPTQLTPGPLHLDEDGGGWGDDDPVRYARSPGRDQLQAQQPTGLTLSQQVALDRGFRGVHRRNSATSSPASLQCWTKVEV